MPHPRPRSRPERSTCSSTVWRPASPTAMRQACRRSGERWTRYPKTMAAARTTFAGFGLSCRIAPDLWEDETWHELATRQLRLARDAGALTVLPLAATYRAGVHVHAGEFAAAAALIEEADAITEATGNAPLMYSSLVLAAWRGQEAQALELIEASREDAARRGEGRAITLAEYATAVLYNGLGGYQAALAAAQRACEYDDLGLFAWALIELVEAAARSREPELAVDALERLSERTRLSGTDWALGVEARSRALLSNGRTAEDLYLEAIERLGRCRIKVHLARTHLLYGEWLRRENRRIDARETAAHRARDVLDDGRRGIRRARRPRAARHRREGAQTHRRHTRSSSPPRRSRSPSSRATATRTPRSARSCSSARGPSSTTCTRCSRSSKSARATSSSGCSRAKLEKHSRSSGLTRESRA